MGTQDNLNGLLNYTSRDYNSIMDDFKALVPTLTDLWRPEADSDPGVVLGKFLASVADMLSVNTDLLANEMFAPSVTQRKNADKIFGLIGYKLGWYTAARTEVTFTNLSTDDTASLNLDFGFNGSNFTTLKAYSDIAQESRVITYNILPFTNGYGSTETRRHRDVVSDTTNVFADHDRVTLRAGESVTRVAIEGELRNVTVSVTDIKKNNYIINLPSQHVDTTAIWIKGRTSLTSEFLSTQWKQVSSAAEFVTPEPRFAVIYDSYGNAQIQISNYLNELENYNDNYLTVFWIDCSGVIGCIGTDALEDLALALPPDGVYNNFAADQLGVSNLSNTVELPHTHTVTGKSPETAKEAYLNSRNYINTWDSLITLPDFNRFLRNEPGVDCGLVIDCQKAYEINKAIYESTEYTATQKAKMYITSNDFPVSDTPVLKWDTILKTEFDADKSAAKYFPEFKPYTAMCFAIHNDFQSSNFGEARYGQTSVDSQIQYQSSGNGYKQYKPPAMFISHVIEDYRPLQAMTVELQFGWARIFPWYVVGQIYPVRPLSQDNAASLVAIVKEALRLYFAPANRQFGQKPTVMEVVDVVQSASDLIRYFDAGSLNNPIINWGYCETEHGEVVIRKVDIECFNPISYAKYEDVGSALNNIRVAPDYILK